MNYRFFGLVMLAALPSVSFAAVAVAPAAVTPDQRTVFTISATADRAAPLTEIRLFVPVSVREVTPSVKQGWAVEIIPGSGTSLQEIAWRGGAVPPGYRDEFSFEATAADAPDSSIKWIIIEGYQDGETVSWDSDPAAQKPNPAPITDVSDAPKASDWYGKVALFVAALALLLGITSLLRHF